MSFISNPVLKPKFFTPMTIKISNLHPSIRLSHVVKLFSHFGTIKAVCAGSDELAYFIKFDVNQPNPDHKDPELECLSLNGFVLANKPLKLKRENSDIKLTVIKDSIELFIFNFCGPENELIYETQKYGNIQKIHKLDRSGVNVPVDIIQTFADRYIWVYQIKFSNSNECKNVFFNLYGRWFNKKQIFCCFK